MYLLNLHQRATLRWVCLFVVTFVASFGPSLHALAGPEHHCKCSAWRSEISSQASRTPHFCTDERCPFLTQQSDGNRDDPQPSPDSSDPCSICQVLAQLENGLIASKPLETAILVIEPACEPANVISTTDSVCHAPRGPPRLTLVQFRKIALL